MSDEPEFVAESDEGGPKKTFWEHLNDLRRALVRAAAAIGIAFVICLCLANRIVAVLEYPLRHMNFLDKAVPTVSFEIGSSRLGPYTVTREQFPLLPSGDAPHVTYRLGTAKIGSEDVLTLTPDPSAVDAASLPVRLLNLSPAEGFIVAFHVALYGAIAVSSPFWIYSLGGFLLPALNHRERRFIGPWLAWSVVLFTAGAVGTYFGLLPLALRASVEYSYLLGFSATDWRAEDYITFVSKFIFGMGLGFQFPLVVLSLVKLGILTHQQLAHYRRHVIIISFILGALLTTPEVITQIAMAVPLYLLYETCIWIAWYWERKKRLSGEIAPS